MAGPLYRKLTQLLTNAGCRFIRQGKGSHEVWYSPISKQHFAVPYDIQKTTTANAILKQAGLPKTF